MAQNSNSNTANGSLQPPTPMMNNILNTNNSSGHNHGEHHDDQLDHSILIEPLNLSKQNVAQIAYLLSNATPEVKDLLLNECNIIYECRICANLFRSLANFICHKRMYCKKHKCEEMQLYDPSWFTPEQQNVTNDDTSVRSSRRLRNSTLVARKVSSQNFVNKDLVGPDNEDLIDNDEEEETTSASFIRSPSKVLNQRSTLNLSSPSRNIQKRKNLDSNNLQEKYRDVSSPTGISPLQFYSDSIMRPIDNGIRASSKEINGHLSKKRQAVQSSAESSKKGSYFNKKDYRPIQARLRELVRRQLGESSSVNSNSGESPVLSTDKPLLSQEDLNELYQCRITVRCPHCSDKNFTFFVSAIRHLIDFHKCERYEAKWISYLNAVSMDGAELDPKLNISNDNNDDDSESGTSEDNLSGDITPQHQANNQNSNLSNSLSDPEVKSCRIIRMNQQYQALPMQANPSNGVNDDSLPDLPKNLTNGSTTTSLLLNGPASTSSVSSSTLSVVTTGHKSIVMNEHNSSMTKNNQANEVSTEVITIDSEDDSSNSNLTDNGDDDIIFTECIPNGLAQQSKNNKNNHGNIANMKSKRLKGAMTLYTVEKFENDLAEGMLKDEIFLDLDDSMMQSISEHANLMERRCIKCPQSPQFPSLTTLKLHVAISHCEIALLQCNMCHKYATQRIDFAKTHLSDNHGVQSCSKALIRILTQTDGTSGGGSEVNLSSKAGGQLHKH